MKKPRIVVVHQKTGAEIMDVTGWTILPLKDHCIHADEDSYQVVNTHFYPDENVVRIKVTPY